jgi:hypothetical protein
MDATLQPEYIAFMLRLWKARDDNECWRASLEDVRTGEKRGFTSVEDLFAYLRLSTESSEKDAKDLANHE